MSKLLYLTATMIASAHAAVTITWASIPGGLKQISMTRNAVTGREELWGVNTEDKIWTCQEPCDGVNNNWRNVGGLLKQISAGPFEVWGVNSNDDIFRCRQPCNGGDEWKGVGGKLKWVSVGQGVIWGVNSGDYIWRARARPGEPINWEQMPGRLAQVSVGMDGDVWGVNWDRSIFQWIEGAYTWRSIGGKLTQISSGMQFLWGVNTADGGAVWRCQKPCTHGSWARLTGSLNSITAEYSGDDRVYGTNSASNIFRGIVAPVMPVTNYDYS